MNSSLAEFMKKYNKSTKNILTVSDVRIVFFSFRIESNRIE